MGDQGLEQDMAKEWAAFVEILKSNFICLKEDDIDSLCWVKNPVNGMYSVKLGYLVLAEEDFQESVQWWWAYIWKLKAPLKVS